MYSVVMPVLNECENLKVLLPKLKEYGCEILVCDNGSTDGSQDVAKQLGTRLVPGWGSVSDAILRGIEAASHDRIVIMDADLSHPPEVVSSIAEKLIEYDLVVGSRYCRGGKNCDTRWNWFISRGYNTLVWPLNFSVRDKASGFFGIRKELAVKVSIRSTLKPMLEYLVKAEPTSVCEVPFTFVPRTWGKSKLGKPVFKTLVDIILLYLRKNRKIIKYALVGSVGTGMYLGILALLTEVAGLWYMMSAAVGILFAFLWNFAVNNAWTFARERSCRDSDYEWNAWYKGNPLQKWWKRKTGRMTKKMLGDPERILDIGCGSSPLINEFHSTRVGVDRDKGKLDFISKHSTATFIQCDLDEGGIPLKEKFDAIICNNILEHLRYPAIVVSEVDRLLSSNGSVVVTFPDVSNPFTRIVEYLYGKLFQRGYQKEHYSKLTTQKVDTMFARCGLRRIEKKWSLTDVVLKYVRKS